MAHFILGIDEVGRGPWAGPLVMGGCILPKHDYPDEKLPENLSWILELTDSKKLSLKKRKELYDIIKANALASATGWVPAAELNEIGLSAGLRLACRRTVENIQKQGIKFSEIIIDGPINFLSGTSLQPYVTNLNKADLLIKEVSAASIVAKVERDDFMVELGKKYPEYKFERHVGYGTAAHISAIEKFGLTPEHRTFIKRLRTGLENGTLAINERHLYSAPAFPNNKTLSNTTPAEGPKAPDNKSAKNTTTLGNLGESAVAEFLESEGHEILARNYKTKYYEIDIISKKSDRLFFTEVKYRKNFTHGTGLEAITKTKQEQMAFAAELYMKNFELKNDFCLAAAQVSGPDFRVDDWFEIQ